jgi:predicted ATP-dependent endonuclease of OLD family
VYLKSFKINNFRKFRTEDNTVDFVDGNDYKDCKIAEKTTLIIGKNNSGKTSIIEALKCLINQSKFCATDFNFDYLKGLMEAYTINYLNSEDEEIKEVPTLSFILSIIIDNSKEDLLTNIIPFMTIGDTMDSEIEIIAKWIPKDSQMFLNEVKKFVGLYDTKNKAFKFDKFLELINKSEFVLVYYNTNNEKRDNFSLRNLIDLHSIEANNLTNSACLSDAFTKIIDYRYKQIIKMHDGTSLDELDEEIMKINEKLTDHIGKEHTDSINSSIGKMLSEEKCKVLLKADLSFQTLLKNVMKYEFVEGNNNIPEKQFGLGYTKLMKIVADIISYMEKYPEDSFNSQINLISIEEPETYMHPQMQELFIRYIDEMISSLLEEKSKCVNSQIIITTHSPHILNGKIHEGNSFNNINYITSINSKAVAVKLNNDLVLDKPSDGDQVNQEDYRKSLKFIKKHVKFKVSELFFSDAVIFVEGITEYNLLQYYLAEDKRFSKQYISIILIDGAHAKVYEKLIHTLRVPTLIITDIDIKREKFEKYEKDEINAKKHRTYLQMNQKSLKGRLTTNNTLSYFYETDGAKNIIDGDYKKKNNLMVLCQKQKVKGYYPTSFEEAYILTNHANDIVNTTIERVKPDIYKSITEKEGGLVKNSYKLQMKLSDSKSEFANEMLYAILTCEDDAIIPALPQYIIDGLDFLAERLGE